MRSSQEWHDHFRRNAAGLLEIPWGGAPQLSDAERRAVARSIQIFQLGESSEGRHLMACARRHAEATGDSGYAEAARLFIKEEQRHDFWRACWREFGAALAMADPRRARIREAPPAHLPVRNV